MLISQLAPSRNDASSCGPQNPKSSKVSDDTNSEEDICIPAIYVKVVTLDLNLLIQTNNPNKNHIDVMSIIIIFVKYKEKELNIEN